MLPVDIIGRRLRLALDKLHAYLGEALILGERLREAGAEGNLKRIADLVGEYRRMAAALREAGRELAAVAAGVRPGSEEEGDGFQEALRKMDACQGTDLEERAERTAELLRRLAMLQGSNAALFSALACEMDRYTSFLMHYMGGWIVYGEEGTAVAGAPPPRRISYSV